MLCLSNNSCNISFRNFVQCFVKIVTIKMVQQLEKFLNSSLQWSTNAVAMGFVAMQIPRRNFDAKISHESYHEIQDG